MPSDADTRYSVRLLETEPLLAYGAALAGENRAQFIRQAIRERVRRLESESEKLPTQEDRA